MILTTIALLVLFASIFIFFSEELRGFVKNVLENRKVMFIVSLFLSSMLVLYCDEQFNYLVVKIEVFAYYILYYLGLVFSRPWRIIVGKILILTLVAYIPFIISVLFNKLPLLQNKTKNLQFYCKILSAYLWVLFCVLLAVPENI